LRFQSNSSQLLSHLIEFGVEFDFGVDFDVGCCSAGKESWAHKTKKAMAFAFVCLVWLIC
jgi:hypothetical protein